MNIYYTKGHTCWCIISVIIQDILICRLTLIKLEKCLLYLYSYFVALAGADTEHISKCEIVLLFLNFIQPCPIKNIPIK